VNKMWIVSLLACAGLALANCGSGSAAGRPDAGEPDAGQPDGDAGDYDGQSLHPRWQVTADWPTGDTCDIVAEGQRLYTVNTCGLMIYDCSNPDAAVLMGRYSTPGLARRLAHDGELAAVSDGPDGIVLLDVAHPEKIEKIASLPVAGEARGVALGNGLLVAGSSSVPARLFDVSDPRYPLEMGALPGFAGVAAFYGDRVLTFGPLRSPDEPLDPCTLDTRKVLRVLDVDDPRSPLELGSIQYGRVGHNPACDGHAVVMPHAAWGLAVYGHHVYVVESESRLRHIDLSDPANPLEVGQVYVSAHWVRGLDVEAGRLLAHTSEGVQVFDLADPQEPELVDTIQLPAGHTVQNLAARRNKVVLSSHGDIHELYVLDTSDASKIALQGVADIAHPYIVQLAMDESRAYVLGFPGFMVFDLQDPARPQLDVVVEDLGDMRALAVDGNLALLAGRQRLVTLDLSEPKQPMLLGDLDVTEMDARHVAVDGGLGLVVAGSTSISLLTLDLRNAEQPALYGRIELSGVAPGQPRVTLSGNMAFVACGTGGLIMVDVGNPAEPVQVGDYQPWTGDFVSDVAINRGLAFVTAGSYVHVLDISDPAEPVLLEDIDTPGYATRVVSAGEKVVVGDSYDLALIAHVE